MISTAPGARLARVAVAVAFGLPAGVALPAEAGRLAEAPRAIVLVSVDTLRADAVSYAGGEVATTPYVDRLAEEGRAFLNAYAPSSWTVPSMASLFTSHYPASHGVDSGSFVRTSGEVVRQPPLPESFLTLAEFLQGEGYLTIGVPSNRHLEAGLGFEQGFDHYNSAAQFAPAPQVNELVRAQLRTAFGDDWRRSWKKRPTFLWIHYFDPHAPYEARKPWVQAFSARYASQPQVFPAGVGVPELRKRFPSPGPEAAGLLLPLYRSEVRYFDETFAELGTELGLDASDVLFILTSDHGEEFAEHGGLDHGRHLFEEVVRVPLLLRWPAGLAAGLSDARATLLDVYPTIAELVTGETPGGLHGRSLVASSGADDASAAAPIRLQLSSHGANRRRMLGVVEGDWKLIRGFGADERSELYNLSSDPREQVDLALRNRDLVRRLEVGLKEWLAALPRAPAAERRAVQDDELKRQLRALGYID